MDEDKTQLIDFKGVNRRSLATDDMNDLYIPEYRTWFKFFLSLIAILLFIVVEIAVIIGMFYFMLYLETDPDIPYTDFVALEILIPVAIWMVMALFFDEVFRPLALALTRWENHKYLSGFETSYIIKGLL